MTNEAEAEVSNKIIFYQALLFNISYRFFLYFPFNVNSRQGSFLNLVKYVS